jgi:hypothetical protein
MCADGDLTVGWISRSPRMDYVWGSADPTREGWPAPGQSVTWEAHVKSWFDHDLTGVSYRWLLDGGEVARGQVDLPAGASVTVGLPWKWTFTRHELTFDIDFDGRVEEDEEGNNRLSVFTDALSVGFYVEQSLYDLFHEKQHLLAGAHSNCWEDWAQRNVRRYNVMAARAVYPETPNGVLDRWRIDEIVVVPDGSLPLVPLPNEGEIAGQPNGRTEPNTSDRSVDLIWGFQATDAAFFNDFTTTDDTNGFYFEGSLVHELGHARYLVDVYGWWVRSGVDGDRVDIREGNTLIAGSSWMPASGPFVHFSSEQGLMNESYGFIDRYSAIALNRIAGRRATRGNYNEPENIGGFLNDLPAENRVTVRSPDGFPIADADVWIYQATGGPPFSFSKIYDDVPDLKLRTDSAGRVLVGRCPFSADGRIVHTFGASNVTAIVRVAKGSSASYGFIESLGFNIAYWSGKTDLADHDLYVSTPLCGLSSLFLLTPAPESTGAAGPVTFSWFPVSLATSYEVWASSDGTAPRRLAVVEAAKEPSLSVPVSGHVTWWVVAILSGCPPIRSGFGSFTASLRNATFFVPVVASSHGSAGSFFTTEMTLTNRGSEDARVTYRYTDATGSVGVTDDTVPAGHQFVVPDAIGYLEGKGVSMPSGDRLGTLRVSFEGLSDEGAAAVTLRTTTPVGSGRAGLAYAGVPPGGLFNGPAFICGLRQDDRDRSNVAVQNSGLPEDGPLTLRLTEFSGDGKSQVPLGDRTLAPGEFFQISGVLALHGSGSNGFVKVERIAGAAPFFAYGVINDRVTSDGSFIPPVSEDLLPVRSWTLPVAAETAVFSTEVILTNLSATARSLRLTFVPSGSSGSVILLLDLAPYEQRSLRDFVQLLREEGSGSLPPSGGTVVGSVFVEDLQGDAGGLFVGGRVTSPGAGGRLGVFQVAVPAGAAAWESAWLYGLRQDGENRTNLAIANTGEAGSSRDSFDLDIFDGDTGTLVVSVADAVSLDAGDFLQIESVLSRFAPGTSKSYVRVRRTRGGNPFVTYAVINDGAQPGERTDDGAIVPSVR